MSTTAIMAAEDFHWGILGLGKIAHQFAQALTVVPGAKLVSVASRSLDRAAAFARQYQASHAGGSYAALFDGPRLDAIYIATPHTSHCELTLMCLERGIPVLCEKPMGLNSQEVSRMVTAARRERVFLMEALWTRFLPHFRKTIELVQAGAIGSVQSIKADFGFLAGPASSPRILDPALGGGALLDIGIYPVFLAYMLYGEPHEVIAAARLSAAGVDLDTAMILRAHDGRLAHLHATLLARTKTEAFIYGDTGTLHLHSRWHDPSTLSLLRTDERPELFTFDRVSNGYQYEAIAVQEAVRAGQTECPDWTLEDSLALHRTLDRVRATVGVRYPSER